MWVGVLVVMGIATLLMWVYDRPDLSCYGFVMAVMGFLALGDYIEKESYAFELRQEVREVKKECEMSLPRDKLCEIVVTAKPKEE